MAALTPTKVVSLDVSAGTKKLKVFTVTPSSASDTVDLSAHFSSIDSFKAEITGGLDAALTHIVRSISGTTVTLVQKKADGTTAADDWTGAQITLWVIGEDEALG